MTPEQIEALITWVRAEARYAAADRAESDYTRHFLTESQKRCHELLEAFGLEQPAFGEIKMKRPL